MFFEYEEQAKNHAPVPDGLSMFDECGYRILSEIYALYQKGIIAKEEAIDRKRKLKSRALKEIQLDNFRDNTAYEREKILRLSEQARTKARKDPTPENCIELVDTIDGILKNELQQNVILSEHGANCPCCNKFFNQDHVQAKPRFCENCGAMLVWKDGKNV